MSNLKITVAIDSDRLASEVMERIYPIFVDGWLDAVSEFQANSPRGATGELRSGWDINEGAIRPYRRSVEISNDAESSLFRIAGRGPGKMPPREPIAKWAIAKGIPVKAVYAIRKKIAKQGTDRWIDQDNWVGINNDGSVVADGRLIEWLSIIESRIKKEFG